MEQHKTSQTSRKCWKLIKNEKQKQNKGHIKIISVLFLCFLANFSCNNAPPRNFFPEMKEKYSDMRIHDRLYFIKSFGLAKKGVYRDGNYYWKINSDSGSYFFLPGYLRKEGDIIWYVPTGSYVPSGHFKEYQLFNFKADTNDRWALYYGKDGSILYGDSVQLKGTNKVGKELFYHFRISEFEIDSVSKIIQGIYHKFDVEVNLRLGIVSITCKGVPERLYYKAILQPKEKFINTVGGALE